MNYKLYIFLIIILSTTITCTKKKEFTCDSPLPATYRCLENSEGERTVTSYKIPELAAAGVWNSKDFDFCVQYNNDGTGTFYFKPGFFSQGSTQKFKWGALVDANGEFITSNFGGVYIFHENIDKTVPIDPQIALLNFNISAKTFYGFDLVALRQCPF